MMPANRESPAASPTLLRRSPVSLDGVDRGAPMRHDPARVAHTRVQIPYVVAGQGTKLANRIASNALTHRPVFTQSSWFQAPGTKP